MINRTSRVQIIPGIHFVCILRTRAVYRFTTKRADRFLSVLLSPSIWNISPSLAINVTPPMVDHLPAGCLQRQLPDHRVDHELPRRSERSDSVQDLMFPQVFQGHPGRTLHPRRRCIFCLRQSFPSLSLGPTYRLARRLQRLPVSVLDGHRTDLRYSGEGVDIV